jgi:hypothetical protein
MEALDAQLQELLSSHPRAVHVARALAWAEFTSVLLVVSAPLPPDEFAALVVGLCEALPRQDAGGASVLPGAYATDYYDDLKALKEIVDSCAAILSEKALVDLRYGIGPGAATAAPVRRELPLVTTATGHGVRAAKQARLSALQPLTQPEPAPSLGGGNIMRRKDLEKKELLVAKFVEILSEAGPAAALTDRMATRYGNQADTVMRIVLGQGAASTLEGHLGRWKLMAAWVRENAPDHGPYPLTTTGLARYLDYKRTQRCGPSVPSMIRSTAIFVSERLMMPPPDTQDADVKAICASVTEERAETIRQAPAIPLSILKALEIYVQHGSRHLAVVAWFILVATYGTLRWDDAQHTRTDSLEYVDDGMYGVSWQTKVMRTRQGVKFFVLACGLTLTSWLRTGYDMFVELCPGTRDFLLPAMVTEGDVVWFDLLRPMEYNDFVDLMRTVITAAARAPGEVDLGITTAEMECIPSLTAHSMKTTMPTLMAAHGASQTAVTFQGHWKAGSSMPQRYARNSLSVSTNELAVILREHPKSWHPKLATLANVPAPVGALRHLQGDPRALVEHAIIARGADGRVAPLTERDSWVNYVAATEPAVIDEFVKEVKERVGEKDILDRANPELAPLVDTNFAIIDHDSDADDVVQFYRVAPRPAAPDATFKSRWHVAALLTPDRTACKRLLIVDLIVDSDGAPTLEAVCAICRERRPDVAALFA